MNKLSRTLSKEAEKNLSKLKEKLRELFQLDRGDLDFGLYRVMALKSNEVNKFLGEDLLPQVTEALRVISDLDTADLKKELKDAIKSAEKVNVDPETNSKVQEIKFQIEAVKDFVNPFRYTLFIVRDGMRRNIDVDIAETFNFLLGLRLATRRKIENVLAITGTTAKGENCLILWRNLEKTNNTKLEKWFAKHQKDFGDDFDLIYVNGDHTLNAIKKPSNKWEAITTEPTFRELMFAGAV